MRFDGTLVQWNDDRGFGFIAPDPPAANVFVHVSSFGPGGHRPQLGDRLTFEVRMDNQRRKQAAAVRRADARPQPGARHGRGGALQPPPAAGAVPRGSDAAHLLHPGPALRGGSSGAGRRPTPRRRGGVSARLVVLAVLCLVCTAAYWWGTQRLGASAAAGAPAAVRAAPAAPAAAAVPQVSFQCDGRKHCSQMTSCAEAKFFLNHCPDPRMDGNRDGVPCEQQWCTGPGAP